MKVIYHMCYFVTRLYTLKRKNSTFFCVPAHTHTKKSYAADVKQCLLNKRGGKRETVSS